MSKYVTIMVAVIMVAWLGGWEQLHAAVERPLSSQVSEQMWERLLTAGTSSLPRVAGDSLRAGNLLLQVAHAVSTGQCGVITPACSRRSIACSKRCMRQR